MSSAVAKAERRQKRQDGKSPGPSEEAELRASQPLVRLPAFGRGARWPRAANDEEDTAHRLFLSRVERVNAAKRNGSKVVLSQRERDAAKTAMDLSRVRGGAEPVSTVMDLDRGTASVQRLLELTSTMERDVGAGRGDDDAPGNIENALDLGIPRAPLKAVPPPRADRIG